MTARFRISWRGLWAALPDWAIAGGFLITWVRPFTFGPRSVRHAMYVMLLEFIVVHSTPFLGAISLQPMPFLRKTLAFIGMVLLYSLFAGAFSLAYGSPWPLLAFWGLTLAKFPSTKAAPEEDEMLRRLGPLWAVMVAAYLFGAFLTTLAPVPPLGITRQVIEQQGFTTSGVWPEEPYRVVAFGVIYFAILGLYGLLFCADRGGREGLSGPGDSRQDPNEGLEAQEA